MKPETPKQKQLVSDAMKLLGQRTSKRKAQSSAANGKLGGAPARNMDAASIARRKKYAEKKAKSGQQK